MISLSTKDIKIILQIDEPDLDEYIDKMLPLVIDMVEDYCNDTFSVRGADGKYVMADNAYILTERGIVISIAKIIEFYMHKTGVTQESISRVMYSYTSELPKSITEPLNSHRKVKFV